jgi:hypothetical protein
MGRVITLIMLLLAASVLTITNYSWAEGIAAPPPTVKLIGPNSLTEDLKAEKEKNTYTADFSLSVENDGTQAIVAPISQSNWIGGGYRIILVMKPRKQARGWAGKTGLSISSEQYLP